MSAYNDEIDVILSRIESLQFDLSREQEATNGGEPDIFKLRRSVRKI